eukprot:156036-Chlamydomonas_euryale.AAC.2
MQPHLKLCVRGHDARREGVVLEAALKERARAVGLVQLRLDARPHQVEGLVPPVHLVRLHAEGLGQLCACTAGTERGEELSTRACRKTGNPS